MIHSMQLKEIRAKLADKRTLSLNAKEARLLLEDYDRQLNRLDEYYDLTDRMIDFIREQGLIEKWKESHQCDDLSSPLPALLAACDGIFELPDKDGRVEAFANCEQFRALYAAVARARRSEQQKPIAAPVGA